VPGCNDTGTSCIMEQQQQTWVDTQHTYVQNKRGILAAVEEIRAALIVTMHKRTRERERERADVRVYDERRWRRERNVTRMVVFASVCMRVVYMCMYVCACVCVCDGGCATTVSWCERVRSVCVAVSAVCGPRDESQEK